MRKRLLASLIVCVALLTQLGASFWGAAAARDGVVRCHMQAAAALVSADSATDKGATSGVPAGAPAASHDHASCLLCQLGVAAIGGEAPVLPARAVKPYWRVGSAEPETPPLRSVFNRSAPARAPPSRA